MGLSQRFKRSWFVSDVAIDPIALENDKIEEISDGTNLVGVDHPSTHSDSSDLGAYLDGGVDTKLIDELIEDIRV